METDNQEYWLLAGSWDDREGIVLHEKGESPTSFTMNWEIDLLPCEAGPPRLRLRRLDLVGMPCELPAGETGLLSLTSAPQIGGMSDLGYDPESGEFSVLVPMLAHTPLSCETPAPPEEEDSHEASPIRGVVMARFEGRFHERPVAEAGKPLEMEVEVRGLAALFDREQDWGLIASRVGRPEPGRLLGPPQVEPPFLEVHPIFRGLVIRTIGAASTHPPIPFCAYHAPLRKLLIQPVFVDARGPDPLDPDRRRYVRDLPRNPHLPGGPLVSDLHKISGKSFERVMQRARDLWKKVCLELEVLPPKAVRDTDYFTLDSLLEASHFSNSVRPDGKSVLVFVADRWNVSGQSRPAGDPTPASVFRAGAYTGLGGTASAYVMTVDSQIDVPASGPDACRNGASGAVNLNHLAHEIGHVVGLNHPGQHSPASGALPASYPGTKGSVMEPSGYCADNPSKNGRGNAELMHNPLLRNLGHCCGGPDIDDIVKRWWETP